MLKVGEVLTTSELVKLLGTDRQKQSYAKDNKLKTNVKNSLLKKLDAIAQYEEIKNGKKKYYKILRTKDSEESLLVELRNKSTEAIDKKIYNYLNGCKSLTITPNEFIKRLNLVKEDFWKLYYKDNEFLKGINVDIEIIKLYSSLLKYELKSIINASLKRLRKNNKLSFEEVTLIANKDGSMRKATKGEEGALLLIEQEALNKVKCTTLRGVMFIGALGRYNKIIKDLLLEAGFDDVDYFYKAYAIDNIEKDKPISKTEEEIIDNTLNQRIRKMIYSRCKNRREKAIKNKNKELGFGESLLEKAETKENFLEDINKLIDYTL